MEIGSGMFYYHLPTLEYPARPPLNLPSVAHPAHSPPRTGLMLGTPSISFPPLHHSLTCPTHTYAAPFRSCTGTRACGPITACLGEVNWFVTALFQLQELATWGIVPLQNSRTMTACHKLPKAHHCHHLTCFGTGWIH